MVELAYTTDLKSVGETLWVRIPSVAPKTDRPLRTVFFWFSNRGDSTERPQNDAERRFAARRLSDQGRLRCAERKQEIPISMVGKESRQSHHEIATPCGWLFHGLNNQEGFDRAPVKRRRASFCSEAALRQGGLRSMECEQDSPISIAAKESHQSFLVFKSRGFDRVPVKPNNGRLKMMLDNPLLLLYNNRARGCSSAGQSAVFTSQRSRVRAPTSPPEIPAFSAGISFLGKQRA